MLSRAPNGTIWRLGADQSTTFETDADLVFGEVAIPRGAYSLWARRVDARAWELIFNSETGQWGLEHDPRFDLASVPLRWSRTSSGPEMFAADVVERGDSGELEFSWGRQELELSLLDRFVNLELT